MSLKRIFLVFADDFTPILGELNPPEPFSIPSSCFTINDVNYAILKKYKLKSIAIDGIKLKLNNKSVLLPRDDVNSIENDDVLQVIPRAIKSNWKQLHPKKNKKRKRNSIQQSEQTQPSKKRKLNENIHNDSDPSKQSIGDTQTNKIESINDALKLLEDRKKQLNQITKYKNIKYNDRLRIFMNGFWESGTVVSIYNDDHCTVELQMDDDNKFGFLPTKMSLLEIDKWDFEPINFAPPRLLNKIKKRHSNFYDYYDNVHDTNNAQSKIKELIHKSGNCKLNRNELKCKQIIAYKTLELIGWQPVYSQINIGTIILIGNDNVEIQIDKHKKENIKISDLYEIYQIKKENIDNTNEQEKSNKIKEKRKKRKKKQKQKKLQIKI